MTTDLPYEEFDMMREVKVRARALAAMGPIERTLRRAPLDGEACYSWLWGSGVGFDAFRVVRDARRALGFDSMLQAAEARAIPDVLSEAIEAAEALGL